MGKKKISKTARQIVEAEMPNCRVVDEAETQDALHFSKAEATTPNLDALKRKYLGSDDASSDSVEPEADALGGENDDTEIVHVEPKNASARDRRARAKAVVVSKSQGKIIGTQG